MESNALARLKRLAGKQTVVLTHYGRKSGKPYEVKIWFVVDGDRVFIGTANVKRQWVQNVQKNPRIKLSVGGDPKLALRVQKLLALVSGSTHSALTRSEPESTPRK